MRMNSHFSSVTLSYTPNSLSSFPHTNGPVPSPSQLFAALDWNWCLGSSNTSPWVQCPDLAAFAHTHKMHEKVEMLCWRAVSFPTIPTFIASRHLADKFSCLHNSLTPAVMQLIILKHKRDLQGQKYLFFSYPVHWLPAKSDQLNSQLQSMHSCEISETQPGYRSRHTAPLLSPVTEFWALTFSIRANSSLPLWLCHPINWMRFLNINNCFWNQQMKQNKAQIL